MNKLINNTDTRFRFRGHATEVFVTQIYDLLPINALKGFRKYDQAALKSHIDVLYAHVDLRPYLEQPADYSVPTRLMNTIIIDRTNNRCGLF